MRVVTRILFSFCTESSRLETEADGCDELVEVIGHRLVEAIQLSLLLGLQRGVASKWLEQPGRQGRADPFKQLQEDHADGVAVRQEAIATRVGQFLHQPFGAEFPEVVAERCQAVAVRWRAQSFTTCG